MGVNGLPKTVTRQRRGCDLNPGPSVPESSTLTTRLPSHCSSVGFPKCPISGYYFTVTVRTICGARSTQRLGVRRLDQLLHGKTGAQQRRRRSTEPSSKRVQCRNKSPKRSAPYRSHVRYIMGIMALIDTAKLNSANAPVCSS